MTNILCKLYIRDDNSLSASAPYEDMIENELYKAEHIDKNIAIKYQLQANYKTGFWEIIILHTKSLAYVPDDMMRCNYL